MNPEVRLRARVATTLSLLVICLLVPAAAAHAGDLILAQDTETEGGEAGNTSEGEGQSDADAETGAGEGEQEGGTSAEEEGPPWTYQMARIGLGLLAIVGLLMGLLYYRMIASRQRAV